MPIVVTINIGALTGLRLLHPLCSKSLICKMDGRKEDCGVDQDAGDRKHVGSRNTKRDELGEFVHDDSMKY